MTREERDNALKVLNNYDLNFHKINGMLFSAEEIANAFDIAIKALEQEPCYNPDEWCHDCLEYNHDKHCCPRFNKIIRNTVEEIKQPKTGHWIYEKRKRLINETDEGAEYVTDYWCKCSKCGGDFGYRKMKDVFCKYCGARMIEPQESENKE